MRFKIVGLAIALLAPSSHAGMIGAFTDRPAFNAALAGNSLTLEDFTPGPHFPITTGVLNSATNLPGIGITPGTIQPGVTYSTPIGTGPFFNIDAGGGFVGGFLDGFRDAYYVPHPLTVAFDGPARGFGFDTNILMGSSFALTINFASGPAFSSTFDVTGGGTGYDLQFFGFVSDSRDITSAVISGTNFKEGFALDNFTFTAAAASVPEPSSLALCGIAGVMALEYSRRRRK